MNRSLGGDIVVKSTWYTCLYQRQADTEKNSVRPQVGYGVGNMILPLIEEGSSFRFLASDFSPRAVALLNQNQLFSGGPNRAFVCDMTTRQLLESVNESSVDIVTMIFMLSAVSPEKMPAVIRDVSDVS